MCVCSSLFDDGILPSYFAFLLVGGSRCFGGVAPWIRLLEWKVFYPLAAAIVTLDLYRSLSKN